MKDTNDLLTDSQGLLLDLACGANKQAPLHGQEWFGIDVQDLPGVNLVHDLNMYPWPLSDNCARLAVASHLIEHIPNVVIDNGKTRFPFIEFMNEVWRLLRVGGEFAIAYPHGSSQGFLQDPTHVSARNETTWCYFDPLDKYTGGLFYKFYRPKPWEIKSLFWNPAANVEVVLIKRMMDRSYLE